MKPLRSLRLVVAGALVLLPFVMMTSATRSTAESPGRPARPRSSAPSPHPASTTGDTGNSSTTRAQGVPRYAYYYIWFTEASWRRAKSDRPLLGRYDSGDPRVMRQHVEWAKAAGIDGFIVSWKHTPKLDERLGELVDIAQEEHFALAIIYQGLDFDRQPIPTQDIDAGLTWFEQHLAARAPFHRDGKPLVIWSGTWKFSHQQIASVTRNHRSRLRILASAKNRDDYLRVADVVDGNAYYWSSVNPESFVGYPEKLESLGATVHRFDGTWIAPAAVGFDARLIGGKTVVERRSGSTFRTELTAASASSPDLVGLISWNEFSENSHIEPSVRFGTCALDDVARSQGLPPPEPAGCSKEQAAGVAIAAPARPAPQALLPTADATDSSSVGSGPAYGPVVVGGFAIVVFVALAMAIRRRAERDRTERGANG